MRIKTMAMVATLGAVLAGCAGTPQTPYTQVSGQYLGVLPCVDCSGIKTSLKIVPADKGNAGNFELNSTREGKSDQVLVTKGSVFTVENAGNMKYPLVYQLRGPEGNAVYNLLPLENGDLQLLDTNMNAPQSGIDMTLKRR